MFNWFKKKKSAEEELKERLAKSLENYSESEAEVETAPSDDSTYTDISVPGHVGKVRVKKYTASAVEQLTLTEFEEDVTIVGLDTPRDPWSNLPDSTQWHRENRGK